jgi:hypothetical protein
MGRHLPTSCSLCAGCLATRRVEITETIVQMRYALLQEASGQVSVAIEPDKYRRQNGSRQAEARLQHGLWSRISR